MAKKTKTPLQAALEYVPTEKVLVGLRSAIPEPEPKQGLIGRFFGLLGKLVRAPFKLVGIVTSPFRTIGRALVGGLRRSK